MTVDKKDLVATIAYMIGVKKHIIEQCYDEECHDTLQKLYAHQPATIIRYLCKIRTTLLQKFKKTDDEMRFNLKNLDKLDWYDRDNIRQLEKWGINLIQVNYRSEKYMIDIAKLISENIDKCSDLFYDWVNWSYIRDLFCIPRYNKKGVMKQEFEKYMSNIDKYPFQMYIHWQPVDSGSILYTDGKFLGVLYHQHDDHFDDYTKYRDAHIETKNNIYDFVEQSNRAVIAVDCENSDVYKLYAVLKGLDSDNMSKIEKIYLYDDYHTTRAWNWLYNFTNIPVEHIQVQRVTDRKSLVDIMMTAGICRNYYDDGIDSFILVSSDSDYWGLISSLPMAKFLVMYEYAKCGLAIKNALSEHDIYYCSIDDFCSANVDEFKRTVLFDILEKYLPDIVYLNGKDLVQQIYEEARIIASDNEKEVFFNKYIKTLTLKCDHDGNFKVILNR
ncbi:MAG: NYN domain-containing protein [Ruminococcus sp.]|nr:NYN domain-containing protein [Ruminococcus sp.]